MEQPSPEAPYVILHRVQVSNAGNDVTFVPLQSDGLVPQVMLVSITTEQPKFLQGACS
jgi:hypothetical protein